MAFFHSNFMLQTPHQDHDQNPPSTSLAHSILPSCSPHEFHGVASLLGTRPSTSFPTGIDGCDEMNMREDELSDDGSQLGEKKRRLNTEQVKTLEKSFEQGNKLEPERKLRLARALGLQPRQIAIWFQNRRARWKTKQLEKDFELLKRQFEALRKEKDSLQANNQKLHAEFEDLKILSLKTRESINLKKGTEGSCSNRTEDSSEIKLNISRNPAINSPSAMDHTTSKDGIAQFFQNSSRPEIQVPKMDQTHVKEESLCNMFCGMDDQTGFWPWLEQQHFN